MTIKKGDFIRVDYTGKLAETGDVFDTTIEEVAKENDLGDDAKGSRVVCVGEGHLLAGLDKELEKHKVGESFTAKLQPEDAFGKKSAKLIQLIATTKFKKQGLSPQPGMQVNVDNSRGVIKSVSGGRTLVDFNHPLSGKEVEYDVKILEAVEDPIEQVKELLGNLAGLKPVKVEFAGENKTHVKVTLSQMLPEPIQKAFSDRITQLVSIKKLEFVIGKE